MGSKRMKLDLDRKTVMESFRCTVEMDKKIEAKARHMGESKSRFLLECAETGLKRKARYDKEKTRTLVEQQETMNQMIRGLAPGQEGLRKQLLEYGERMMELWEF